MQSSQDRVTLTDSAAETLREFLQREPEKGVRIFLENGQYAMGLDEPDLKDTILDCQGIKMIVDPQSLKYVIGLQVDLVQTPEGPTFELSSPFASDCHEGEGKGGCGCSH